MIDKFGEAKQVVIALKELNDRRFPENRLDVVGFYTLARRISHAEIMQLNTMPLHVRNPNTFLDMEFSQNLIPYARLKSLAAQSGSHFPGDYTNIQEGLRVSQRILARGDREEKHVFLVTDGRTDGLCKRRMCHHGTASNFRRRRGDVEGGAEMHGEGYSHHDLHAVRKQSKPRVRQSHGHRQ